MNPKELIDIKNKISQLEESINDLQKLVTSWKLDYQRVLKSNTVIEPGISSKVAYDSNGLIVKGFPLEAVDIPIIPIEKVKDLQNVIETMITPKDLESIKENLSSLRKKRQVKPATATKVNYDKDGLITSSTDLSPDDIPILSVKKIKGLNERLEILESRQSIDNPSLSSVEIPPGTFCKISYDKDGRVTAGSKLSMNDIPMELINRINIFESRIPLFASQSVVDGLLNDVIHKVDANPSIPRGTFTKVTVDEKGLVIAGEKITLKDIPKIHIEDIQNLERTLRSKAEHSDLIELTNIVAALSNSTKNPEIDFIHEVLKGKASISQISSLESNIGSVRRMLSECRNQLPKDGVHKEIKKLNDSMKDIIGRLSIIENRINLGKVISNE